MDVARTGGPGQPASVFIRGGNSDHTLVLIDGVRVNPATFGGAQLALIAPEMIERIEVVKGARSSLYGSDALAGVINIITRGPGAVGIDASVRGGSFGTKDVSLHNQVGDARTGLALTVQRNDTDGIPAFVGDTSDRGLGLTTVALRGQIKLSEQLTLKAQGWRAEGNNGYSSLRLGFGGPPDFATTLQGFTDRDHDTLNQTVAAALEYRPNAAWESRLQLSHSTDRIDENQNSTSLRSLRPELRLDNSYRIGAQRISFGGNLAQDRVDVSGGDPIADVRDLSALYVQGEFQAFGGNAVTGVSFNDYDGFDSEFTYNLELGYGLWQGARVIAAYGTGFRAPNANQRFTAFGGNPNLKPERSRSSEVGVQQRYRQHTLDLRVFRNEVRDLISFVLDFSQADFGDNLNVDRARTEGIELAYQGDFGPLQARLDAVLQSPRDCTEDEAGNAVSSCDDGARLKRRNSKSISGSIDYRFARGVVGVEAYGAADRRDFEGQPPFSNNVRNAGYGLLAAHSRLNLLPGLSLALRGENLLDKRYTLANGYQTPGAAGYATLRYQWRQTP